MILDNFIDDQSLNKASELIYYGYFYIFISNSLSDTNLYLCIPKMYE